RAVDVIALAFPATIAGRAEADVHVDGLDADNWRKGVVEVQVVLADQLADGVSQPAGGEWTTGDDRRSGRDLRCLFATQLDERVRCNALGDSLAEGLAGDGKRTTGRDPCLVRARHNQRAEHTKLCLE